MTASIVFTQPYVPRYRVPLFDALAKELAARDMSLTVLSGRPEGEQARRKDQATGPWHRELPVCRVSVGHRRIELRQLPQIVHDADVIVSELSALNLEAWRLAVRGRPLVLWGHGKSYTSKGGWLSDRLEWSLARRAAHVMTYAPSGARFLVDEGGLDKSRVTAIGNSTDTATLRRAHREAVNEAPKESLRASRPPGALFVGGIDSTKRIDFILEAFAHAVALEPGFRLHVVGDGPMANVIDDYSTRDPRIVRYGDLRGRQLADVAVLADAVWMPGRVGLVAVDALALGLPVHTTNFEFHAPEIEFLRGPELVVLPDRPVDFARLSLESIETSPVSLRDDIPSVQNVATSMRLVIERVLGQ
ncbi:glycosyltransferase family 4 protein [Microbacterium sp. No. 7]|uniref:glycosyltransferase family 4 protein n=1 Tax=Microbacterium sp. No. 7 TaxID=1714373 RepID=UPI00300A4318